MRRIITAAVAATITLSLPSCGVFTSEAYRERNPLTPEQAKAQVVDAAKEIVSITDLKVDKAWVELASCNDQGEAPFRGTVVIHYQPASSAAEDRAITDSIVGRLTAAGWSSDAGFHSYAPALHKDGVSVLVYGQGPGQHGSLMDIRGECRDVTSTKETSGDSEQIDLGR